MVSYQLSHKIHDSRPIKQVQLWQILTAITHKDDLWSITSWSTIRRRTDVQLLPGPASSLAPQALAQFLGQRCLRQSGPAQTTSTETATTANP